ncbi:MAG: S8 family serine peptidase, partial [Elainellaceae cyanobacterium]
MARTSLVSPNSPILRHSSTDILHTYRSGDVLVTTTAPALESGGEDEIVVQQGVILPNQENNARRSEGFKARPTAIAQNSIITAYIELIGPVDPDWVTTLSDLGLELLQFQPANSYLSRGSGTAFQQALDQPFVLNVVPLDETAKPATPVSESGDVAVCIVAQGDRAAAPALMQTLSALPGVTIDPAQTVDAAGFFLRILARVDAAGQDALRQHPTVLAVEAHVDRQLEDEVAGLIIAGQYDASGRPQGSYLQWLEDHGLTGEAVTIGIVDAGVDGSHPAFGDRIKDTTQGRKSWHGTFVAGHAAGCYLTEQDSGQFIYGLGIAPKAYLLAQNNHHSATA